MPKKEPEIRVMLFKVNTLPEVITIPNDFKAMQSLVGGLIDRVCLRIGDKPVDLVCNEEGLLERLAPNVYLPGGTVIVGDFFVASTDESEEEYTSLQDEDLEPIKAYFEPLRVHYLS